MRSALVVSAVALFLVALFGSLPTIHKWERENGFPYGRMCHSIFTGYVDTCR